MIKVTLDLVDFVSLQAGTYDYNVTVSNPFSSDTVSGTVTTLDGIIGITVTDNNTVVEPYQTKTFYYQFDYLGVESCMTVNFGDGTEKLYAVNQASCGSGQPAFGGSLVNPMAVTHTYQVSLFIIHPCDPTVVICFLIWPCDKLSISHTSYYIALH